MSSAISNLAPQYLRARMGRVCVAILGTTLEEMLAKAEAISAEHTFLEFRLDYLDKPQSAIEPLAEFLKDHPLVTAIGTCRRKPNGGHFTGSLAAEFDILAQCARAGFHIVDLEIESAEAATQTDIDTLRSAGAALLISHHDFEATGDLDAAYVRIQKFEPDFAKVVPTARSLADNLKLLRFLNEHGDRGNLVGMSMGEFGVISRVLCVRAGSAFTFASPSLGEETAPGQVAARTMIETYRVGQIATGTKIYGVAGNPVSSSMSPIMLNTAFRRENVNAVYLALQTNKLEDLLKIVHELPIHGLSVTMPLKQEILPHLAKTDPLSAKIGAVNTIVRSQDGKLYGFNTDVGGITGPIERRRPIRGAKVLVLGAGGAARAAVFGLIDKGAEVTLWNRTPETAQSLAKQAGARIIKREQLADTHFDIVINSTPVGMNGNQFQNVLEPQELNAGLVFDLVYNPLETPLIRLARQKNIPFITGVEMFVQQGARQFEIWTGKPAPEEEMLRVVLHALRQRAEARGEQLPPPLQKPVTMKLAQTPVPEAADSAPPPAPVAEIKKPVKTEAAKKVPAKPQAVKSVPAPPAPVKNQLIKADPVRKAPAKEVPAKIAVKTIAKKAGKVAGKTAKSTTAKPVAKVMAQPTAKKAVPDVKKLAPVVKKPVVAVKKAVAAVKKAAPSPKKAVPAAKKSAPSIRKAKPAAGKPKPAPKKAAKKVARKK